MSSYCLAYPHHLLQLVELKNGETYNGHMVQCDSWMNVHLREVICTSKVDAVCLSQCPAQPSYQTLLCDTCPALALQDGDRFWRIPETYIRGNTIKYLRVPDEVGGVLLTPGNVRYSVGRGAHA